MNTKTFVCPSCEGKKTTDKPYPTNRIITWEDGGWPQRVCQTCKGTGKVNV